MPLRRLALAVVCATACASTSAVPPQPPATAAPRAKALAHVMVLGVYHFQSNRDYVENRTDDHMAPRRQKEIADVLDRIARFKPTKIVVEMMPARQGELDDRYRRYREHTEALTVNERDQIGMALGARLGLERLYAVDADGNMDIDELMKMAEAHGQRRLAEQFRANIATIEAHTTATLDLSVRDRLIDMNSAEVANWDDFYLTLAQIGTREDLAGARMMKDWWGRNLEIFAQIAQLAAPDDRILVIYGAGHKYQLEHFFGRAHEFALVDPRDYLRDPR